MSDKLPAVVSPIPRDLRAFLDRVRDLVRATGRNRLITADDLAVLNLATIGAQGNLRPAVEVSVFLSTPPAPQNVSATAAIQNIIVEWDPPVYIGHAHSEVWSAGVDDIGQAVLLGMTPGAIFVDSVGPSTTRYYWVRFVNTEDTKGAFNGISGTEASTGSDLAHVMDLLSDTFGGDSEAPFFQIDQPTVIDGVTIPAGTYIKSAFIFDGVITNAKIGNAAIDDAKIANLSAAKITGGAISVGEYIQSDNFIGGSQGWRIDGNGVAEFSNAVVRGTVFATDGRFVGEIIAEGTGGNRARMFSGDFEVYKQVPNVGVVLYKALSRVESGLAANNVLVTIPGYFVSQPRVIVSPANLQLYNHTFANQSQSIQCEALELTQTSAGSMVWQFRPVATLSLAETTGQTVVNQTSGITQTGWTSSQYTTPANTLTITPSVTLASSRGTGTSGVFFRRTVRWRVQYLSGGVFVNGPFTTVNLSDSPNASVTSTATFSFPSANAWTFRIQTEAFDTDGTTFGSTEFETATDSISRTAAVTVTVAAFESATRTLDYTPSYTLPSGWTFVSVTYDYNYSYSIQYFGDNAPNARISGSGLFIVSGSGTSLTRSHTRSDSNSLTFSVTAGFVDSGNSSSASLTLNSVTGTVTRSRPASSTTTANNQFSFNSYAFTLSTAQVLATGTLNWIAIGE